MTGGLRNGLASAQTHRIQSDGKNGFMIKKLISTAISTLAGMPHREDS